MKLKSFLLSIVALLLLGFHSCAEVDVLMPPGPKGEDGKNAYEVWVDQVYAGTIIWPKGEIAEVDFFRYLKGKDGRNGKDGASAYDQWVAYISSGTVANPHQPSEAWPRGTNTMADFWYFLSGSTGENGKTPRIGDDGHWWIGNHDTGVPARGEKGEDGKDGKDGLSPTIGPNGNWFVGTTDTGVPARGKDGKDGQTPVVVAHDNGHWWVNGVDTGKSWKGEKGAPGKEAEAPVVTIGTDGNWYINGQDTGRPSRGKDGKDGKNAAAATVRAGNSGHWLISSDGGKTWEDTGKPWKGKDGISPEVVIGPNKNWWINGRDTQQPAYGRDGQTPYIGNNGHWWVLVNGVATDLNVPARGAQDPQGAQGTAGETPYVGNNGNWWVRRNGVATDLNVPATGSKGDDGPAGATGATGSAGPADPPGSNGTNGKSAYDLWKDEIAKGVTVNPQDPTQYWPATKNSLENFWEYLRGRDGGSTKYEDNQPTVPLVPNKYNVLPLLYNGDHKEYAYPSDGKVVFKVFGKDGLPVSSGIQVKGLPGMDASKTYTTDSDGTFEVPAADLPNKLPSQDRLGEATVIANGEEEKTSPNTLTPNRVNTRLRLMAAYPRQVYTNSTSYVADHQRHVTAVKYLYEREIDGVWSEYPSDYPLATVKTAGVKNPEATTLTEADLDVSQEWFDKWNHEIEYDFLSGPAGTFAAVFRPAVLTDDEKNGQDEQGDLIDQTYIINNHRNIVRKYEWDNQKHYFTVRGVTNFYGQPAIMDAVVHNPEIYPSFDLTDMKISVTKGLSIFYGKFKQEYQPYYYIHKKTTGLKWEAERFEGSTLNDKFDMVSADVPNAVQNYIAITTFNEGVASAGSQSTGRTTANTNVTQFALNPFYNGNYVSTCVRISDQYGKVLYGGADWSTYKSAFYEPYRSTLRYRLKKLSEDHYKLFRVFRPNEQIDLPFEEMPENWDK